MNETDTELRTMQNEDGQRHHKKMKMIPRCVESERATKEQTRGIKK